MALLFEPLTIRAVTIKNRIVMSPMCQYTSEDGFVNDWHLVHLGSRAIGGAGLIMVEATAVAPSGRITPKDLGIWKDEHVIDLKRITEFLEAYGTVPGIQLAHAGRKGSRYVPWDGGEPLSEEDGAWKTLAPSAVPFKEGEPVPNEMTRDEISDCILDFRAAAERALIAGFKVLEIHAAHGYLINEFLSPLSNFRTDEYGGSFENRVRLLLEIVLAVRTVWPEELPLFVRISATEWIQDGWTPEDSIRLAILLKANGVDLIDCSTGGNVTGVRIELKPGYQVPFAAKVKQEARIYTGAVGLITRSEECEAILRDDKADLIFLGRALLRDPYFPIHAAKELGATIAWPPQYLRAKVD